MRMSNAVLFALAGRHEHQLSIAGPSAGIRRMKLGRNLAS